MRHTISTFMFFAIFGVAAMGWGSIPTAPPGRANCTSCHSELLEKTETHFITTSSDCVICHDDLSRAGVHLIDIDRSDLLCVSCHADREHIPAGHADQRCIDCHAPHGSTHQHNLVADAVSLCTANCHTIKDIGLSHPVGDDMRDRRTGGLLTCVSTCHSLHQAHEPKLLQHVSTDLCYQCHNDKF